MTQDILWKDIAINSNYAISNTGEIRNKVTMRTLKLRPNKKGYFVVDLSYNKHLLMHKLVYETFIGSIDHILVIDHIDGYRTNNSVADFRKVITYCGGDMVSIQNSKIFNKLYKKMEVI